MLWEIVLGELRIYPEWQGLPLVPTRAALDELARYGFSLTDVKGVLEEGYDCSSSGRKKGTFEKCVRTKSLVVKAVVVRSYNYSLATECWAVIHIGALKT